MMTKYIITVLISLFALNLQTSAQNIYESLFPELMDDVYYPRYQKLRENKKGDSLYLLAEEAFQHYYRNKKVHQALYLFNLCIYKGSVLMQNGEEAKRVIGEKITFLANNTDTINTHFGAMYQLMGTRSEQNNYDSYSMRLTYLKTAKDIYVAAASPDMLVWSLNISLANSYQNNGYYWKAYQCLKESWEGFEQTKQYHRVSQTHRMLGDLFEASEHKELGLAFKISGIDIMAEHFPAHEDRVVMANNLSQTFIEYNRYDMALRYLDLADSLINHYKQIAPSHFVNIALLGNKAVVYRELGRYEESAEKLQLLEEKLAARFGVQHRIMGKVYEEKARLLHKQEQTDSALYYYREAIARDAGKNSLYVNLAILYNQNGKYKEALQTLEKNQQIMLKSETLLENVPPASGFSHNYSGFVNSYHIAVAYYNLFELNRDKNLLDRAFAYINLGDTLISSWQDIKLIGGFDSRNAAEFHTFTGLAMQIIYELSLLQPDTDYAEYLLNFAGKATAFKLNAETAHAQTYQLAGTDYEKQLDLLRQIRKLENQLLAMQDNANPELLKTTEKQLFNARVAVYELSYQMEQKLRGNNLQNLHQHLTLIDIQNGMAPDEAAVSYYLSDDYLNIVFISKTKLQHQVYPIDESFDDLLRSHYFNLKTGAGRHTRSATQLYDYLIAPFSEHLQNINSLNIIPDAGLNQIPFETLVYKEKGQQYFLIEKMAISYNYSFYLWQQSKQKTMSEAYSFVGFAPVFSEIVSEIDTDSPLQYDLTMREEYREIRRDGQLVPLPFSSEEVIEIAALFRKNGFSQKLFLHHKASEQNLKSQIGKHNIVHIATHGYSSVHSHELSGLFMAASEKERRQQANNDGFVYLGEIYELEQNADLVVLSACKTGTGEIRKGEGVLALPRAFIFSGVPNLMASLWKIHDEKTKNLMIDFYADLLTGNSYEEALRQAKLRQIELGELPLNWSSIILIGR